ncbi:RecQ family ATP-dependent DNA helicase [Cecembia calidifontis]|uniref:DNA 3'-5' helicase n=1 Tax=Cecembia calidifontis TaxID=1187080 RepID=A0A4Q7P6C2_9BACT|nr:RecQ family ATP-dependent DNA helicase [Cecembia calidifontis]RZS95317.1 ATP-dependent DNA helicase RecQ [Cecembia calidifontis]
MKDSNPHICFLDIEVDPQNEKLLDFGAVKSDGSTFHSNNIKKFEAFLDRPQFVCGHNILGHDLPYLQKKGIQFSNVIDTLFLSPLLFPKKPYHNLVKDDKLQTESLSNPLNDAIKARDLLNDQVSAFLDLEKDLQQIFYRLLAQSDAFKGFFEYLDFEATTDNISELIHKFFRGKICAHADIYEFVKRKPIPLAYALSLIYVGDRFSITPPWVLQRFPETDRLMTMLRGRPCLTGCTYCSKTFDIHAGLKRIFGFEQFRTYGNEPLQEKAVEAAIKGESILCIFPTGGGKSITFQLPALMAGEREKALTLVISPLQSLMKDQVDNLEKMGITESVTINGLLDPIERSNSFERVEDGTASILYISPESLRSKSIEKLLLGRKINRVVIDEAHCFSAWGQDFRIDYLYIADFIQKLQEIKNLSEPIPVSCFTATAKQKVIEDIQNFFREKLSLNLEMFRSSVARTNLRFEVVERNKEEEKYLALRDLLEAKACPSIIYVSRTRKAFDLAQRLNKDGIPARAYHGKMDKTEKNQNQDAFIAGEINTMVATSAFGMGVDKKDVGLVVHYEISDSLENYVQEAGRAGRDENIEAECFVLFDEEDLSKHFILLNQTKITLKEIQQVWKAIKNLTRYRSQVSNSALEIARQAGWDDSIREIETRVTTAIAALEDAGYLKRGQNMPKIFASSIQVNNAQDAIQKIESSPRFSQHQKIQAVRIIKKLFSSKSRQKNLEDEAEARIDYIADHLAMVKEEVIEIIHLLREEKILADSKDLQAYIRRSDAIQKPMDVVENIGLLENYLLGQINAEARVFQIKSLNEGAALEGLKGITPAKIRTVINYWSIKNWVSKQFSTSSKNHVELKANLSTEVLKEKFRKRHDLARFILDYLYRKAALPAPDLPLFSGEMPVDFSVLELKESYEAEAGLFERSCTPADVEDALFYLSRMDALKIEGGFLVLYNRLTIERTERDNKARYKQEDYQKLERFYENKVQQIHIVGEYAKKMISDYQDALQFVEDYFQMNYTAFLNKYFKGNRQKEISRNITPAKFRRLFGELSPAQLKIINDQNSRNIVVAAGPGSGKTRILVHKLAALLLMEDVKQEQLLMLTFSRAAATEFKKRLMDLIGNAALFVDIKTFHGYCFEIIGKVGSLDKTDEVIEQATQMIRENKTEPKEVTRTVLVIDEAQDISSQEFALIEALMEQNEDVRVIAVGDDDQNIYEFRGSSAVYLEKFITEKGAQKYELVENYRSKSNLVDFSNQWAATISQRLKTNPIIAHDSGLGSLRFYQHRGPYLLPALMDDFFSSKPKGTIGILCRTNEEALSILSRLLQKNISAKLIQSHEQFHLLQLFEIRFFFNSLSLGPGQYTVPEEKWKRSRQQLETAFGHSNKWDLVKRMLDDFEQIFPKIRYRTDLEEFIRESRIEDFADQEYGTALVSTIHKAKGKEFDQVYMMLTQSDCKEDQERRLLYVGMTRAKSLLSIHYRGNYLDGITAEAMERIEVQALEEDHGPLLLQLGLKDINLGFCAFRQKLIHRLRTGDLLSLEGNDCLNDQGQTVLRFSMAFQQSLAQFMEKGYTVQQVSVNWLVYWHNPETEKDVLVLLPELVLHKENPKEI